MGVATVKVGAQVNTGVAFKLGQGQRDKMLPLRDHEQAGAWPQTRWNALEASEMVSVNSLDAKGQASPITLRIEKKGFRGFNIGFDRESANHRLMSTGVGHPSFLLEGIPYTKYHLVVYYGNAVMEEPVTEAKKSTLSVGTDTQSVLSDGMSGFTGSFRLPDAEGRNGNKVVFRNLTGPEQLPYRRHLTGMIWMPLIPT